MGRGRQDTSVADTESIRSVVSLIHASPTPLTVVVSALAGVTDALLLTCSEAAKHDPGYLLRLDSLEEQHMKIASEIGCTHNGFPKLFNDLREVLRGIFLTSCKPVDQVNYIAGHGEVMSAQLLTHACGESAEFLDARDVIVIQNSEDRVPKIKWKRSQALWDARTPSKPVQIATGFICRTADGRMATLKRNGSDLSAAIFARLLRAQQLVIWKEVDGVFTADPRVVPSAQLLRDISFRELAELSYFGAKVVHPQAMQPAIEAQIPVILRNTFNPRCEGTVISAHSSPGLVAKAITVIKGIALVNVEGCGMLGVPGIAQRVFEAFYEKDINVMLISQASSEYSICVAIQGDQATVATKALQEAFFKELKRHQIEEVEAVTGLSIIAVVGDGMKSRKGVAAKFFSAITAADVNIIAIAQGSSERNISIVIREIDAEKAMKSAHFALFE